MSTLQANNIMKLETSLQIKKESKRLIPLIKSYIAVSGVKEDLLNAILLTIQNASINYRDCINWNREKEIDELYKTAEFLQLIREYEKDYAFVHYICSEWIFIFEGHRMSEDYESTDN